MQSRKKTIRHRTIEAPRLPLRTSSEPPFATSKSHCCAHFIADSKWLSSADL